MIPYSMYLQVKQYEGGAQIKEELDLETGMNRMILTEVLTAKCPVNIISEFCHTNLHTSPPKPPFGMTPIIESYFPVFTDYHLYCIIGVVPKELLAGQVQAMPSFGMTVT